MSYRLINANALAANCKQVNDMPCIYADLPNGLDGGYYDLARAERTCRNLDKHHNIMFKCSECGHWECQDFDGEKILPQTWNYCPNCGCKVVGE